MYQVKPGLGLVKKEASFFEREWELKMIKYRKYGSQPFQIAVIHGGPGAPGSLQTLAQSLAKQGGIIEPMQSKNSISGQVYELREVLLEEGTVPAVLIGHSWGAWLAYLLAAAYPRLVNRLILVGTGPFRDSYLPGMKAEREKRMSPAEKLKLENLKKNIDDPVTFRELGAIMSRVDSWAPLPVENSSIAYQPWIFKSIMGQVEKMRSEGTLLDAGRKIECPVVVIHGDYDPHPFKGVIEPLQEVIKQLDYYLLENCGHYPWREKEARTRFFAIIEKVLQ